ncbi:MAG TPA: polyphosphate kinase 2 family protein [Terriglobales bacterium]|nr:polyphosphate kinase 2 family protein [Terriglobales bacterium]
MSWASKLIKPFRVEGGDGFRLKDFDPGNTGKLKFEEEAKDLLAKGIARMAELQDMLYAQDRWALLLIFQAMDAAGKDGIVKHVMSGVNPQGCQVASFKAPSHEELDHDYMWRAVCRLPERGRIGIFNRSYYEEVLVVRVHPEILKGQQIPPSLVTDDIWKDRFQDISGFERYLSRNGVVVRKFYLNLSKKEQKKRFLARLDQPEKNWKFSAADVHERQYWDDYMTAYEEMIRHTASKRAPWYVVPADNKWFTRVAVAAAVVDTMEELNLSYPSVDGQALNRLQAARAELLSEGSSKKKNKKH